MKWMSWCLGALWVSASWSARAATSVEIEGHLQEAIAQYTTEFVAERGKALGDEVLAVSWLDGAGEAEVTIYEVQGPDRLAAIQFGCHLHGQDTHCVREKTLAAQVDQIPRRNYSVSEMRAAVREALQIIESRVSPLSELRSFKIWHDGRDLQFSAETSKGTAAMMCHHHGAGIDCHRQRQPGSGEPRL